MNSFTFESQDGISVIKSNPFENAKYYLENFSIEKFTELEKENQASLFYLFSTIKFQIMDFKGFELLSSGTMETYLRTAKEFIKFLHPLQSLINLKEYEELNDLYKIEDDFYYYKQNPSNTQLKEELQKFEKEFAKESSSADMLKNKKRPTKEEAFNLYYEIAIIACENRKEEIGKEREDYINFAKNSLKLTPFIGIYNEKTVGQYLDETLNKTNGKKGLFNSRTHLLNVYDKLIEHYGGLIKIPNSTFSNELEKAKIEALKYNW